MEKRTSLQLESKSEEATNEVEPTTPLSDKVASTASNDLVLSPVSSTRSLNIKINEESKTNRGGSLNQQLLPSPSPTSQSPSTSRLGFFPPSVSTTPTDTAAQPEVESKATATRSRFRIPCTFM